MKKLTTSLMLTISYLLLLTAATPAPGPWVQTLTKGNKKITKLHFYVHNLELGPNATVYRVATASITSTSPTSFGQVNVFDDRVTAEPDIKSEQVARAQGTSAYADLQAGAIAMTANFYITSGEFNGSTLVIAGRNPLLEPTRELPVIGGTGAFRLARGYAVVGIYLYDKAARYSVLEYTVYVISRRHMLCV
ncbi:dirigent protein 21-like [Salvia hispanica]|uniref:dirigent protein 21-like n=1 Tax=Salvia hispanica TaxID=49212 RepID=UPI00200914B2|nr:dirigent protein 21-like [Salvia hispanica]